MTKKILITGANRGIGLALVKQAISLNFSVLACYREENNSKELFSIKSNQLSFIKLDVTKKTDFELVKNSIATDLDYLICNAGVNNGYGTFLSEDHDFENIEKVFKINVIGSLMTARYLSTNVI